MSSKISFAVNADSVSLKSIYKKDFLELQMRAISTANPNLNGSWFTEESLQDAIESCKNKPILGYFNDGDFESHNGIWRKDIETGIDYWDTTKNGEQILGFIRENDDIKIVKDEEGLSWLCLSCALWTQYNFKQVKRLIKDAKRAKATGGVTKNISVEIDIIDGEKLENGVYRIDKFNLAGITILGSRQGQKIEPGIANAALSIPEIMGTDFYAKQENMIRAAYARLSGNNSNEKEDEEDILKMANQEDENLKLDENVQCSESVSSENDDENTAVCSKCGQNPCVCNKTDKEDNDGNRDDNCGHMSDENVKTCQSCDDTDAGEENENDTTYANGENNTSDDDEDQKKDDAEQNCNSYSDGCDGEDPKEDDEDKKFDRDVIEEEMIIPVENVEVHDVAWLINNISLGFNMIESTIGFYSSFSEEEFPNCKYIVSVLTRVLKNQKRVQGTLGGLLNKIAGEISDTDKDYEKKLVEYENIDELIDKYENEVKCNKELQEKNECLSKELEACNTEKAEFKTRIDKYEHEKFLGKVSKLINSTNGLDEDKAKEIYSACEDGSLQNYDEVKTKIALIVFEAQQGFENTKYAYTENTTLQSPVYVPDAQVMPESKAEKNSKRDSWAILNEHYGKKSK